MRRHLWLLPFFGLLAAGISGCEDERPPPLEPAGPASNDPPTVGEWRPCASTVSRDATCRFIEVPLDHDVPSGETLRMHVKRIPAPMQPPRGRVWVLQGGPGGPSEPLEGFAPTFHQVAPDLEILLPDHRGTGKSELWTCPQQERADSPEGALLSPAEVADCIAVLEADFGPGAADTFTATAAARDLGLAIEEVDGESPGDDFVWGVSYGTYWAQRYLHVRPTQAAGVVLDSIVAQDTSFHLASAEIDRAAEALFDECGNDDFCTSKLGADPWAVVRDVLTRIDEEDHCRDVELYPGLVRELLASMVQAPSELQVFMAPVVYRLDRCEQADVEALSALLDVLLQTTLEDDFSTPLRLHIGLSEMYQDPPPTQAEVDASDEAALVGLSSVRVERRLFEGWPRYAKDDFHGEYPVTAVPILAINGTLDGQTPLASAERVKVMLTSDVQTFVTVPNATHGTIGDACGLDVQGQFLRDPFAALDLACTQRDRSLNFEGRDLAPFVFGTEDAYENLPPGSSTQSMTSRPRPALGGPLWPPFAPGLPGLPRLQVGR